jgi:WD40 repeat protein
MRQFKTESGNRKIFKKKKFCKIIETQKMPINVIRWSFNGKLLASGGDSGNLTIYSKYIKKNQDNFFRTFHLFQNSQGDISSINWSPDSNFITTTSQTTDVIIFAVKKNTFLQKLLTGFSS